jgi:hypothetical protein
MKKLSPRQMLRVHASAGAIFIAIWITASFTGWVKSPTFISHMSMLALVYAAFGGWQAALAGDKADPETD